MKKAFVGFKLSEFDFEQRRREVKDLIEINKPRVPSHDKSENTIQGFFGYFSNKDNYGGSFYRKTYSTVIDPYTKKGENQVRIDLTSFMYVKKSNPLLFLSGKQQDFVLGQLGLTLQQRQTIIYSPDYIEYLNMAEESWTCYDDVLIDMISVEREGKNDEGHLMKEKYNDLTQRDDVNKTKFRYYAKVKLSLDSGVFDVTVYSDGKLSINNYSGDLGDFSTTLTEIINRLEKSYKAFQNCPNKEG